MRKPAQGHNSISKPCIWMQAGVVRYKHCNRDYQCLLCPYDRALKRTTQENRRMLDKGEPVTGRRAMLVHWKDRLRSLPQAKQPCIHSMKGEIEYKTCPNDYACSSCDFDQYFESLFKVSASLKPIHFLEAEGISLPHGYYLYPGHVWLKLEEDATVRLGLDEFILRILGPLDRVEAPLTGKELKRGSPGLKLERGEEALWALSPITGVVTDINPLVRESGLSNSMGPYTGGWILRAHCYNLREELKHALLGPQAMDFVQEEVRDLFSTIEEQEGTLAADGGTLAEDLCGNLPGLDWNKVGKRFLRCKYG